MRLATPVERMTSLTPTLPDPLEAAPASRHRIRLNTLREPPPWSSEPIDCRWRARGWSEESLG